MARTNYDNIAKPNLTEIGGTGLRAFGGVVQEEFLKQLQGSKGLKTFGEMRDNDAIIGSILFIIDKMLRNVKWKTESADNSSEAVDAAKFIEDCRTDMEHTWEEFISEMLSMLTYGFAPHEVVYKVREDGRIGWRKLPLRGQETVWKWHFDDDSNPNDVTAFEQLLPLGGTKIIPIDKLLLFRTQSFKNNPQGRSILRNSYRSYYFKKKIEEIEGIGIERDLAGLPVAYVPPNLLSKDASDAEKATLAAIQRMVTGIRNDEQAGVVFPLAYDENGKELYKLSLLSSAGGKAFDTNTIITRWSKQIAMTVAADFIFLGMDKQGSYALSSDKTSMFSQVLGAILKDVSATFNRKAIPQICVLNGIPKELYPKLVPGDVEKQDIAAFVDGVYKLIGVGALQPGDDIDEKCREMLDLPMRISDGTV